MEGRCAASNEPPSARVHQPAGARRIRPARNLVALVGAVFLAVPARASAQQLLYLEWLDTTKIEQLIGDTDWQTGQPTHNQSFSKSGVLADGLGYSFDHFDKTTQRNERIYLFGDTTSYGTWNNTPVGSASYTNCGAGCDPDPTPESPEVYFPANTSWSYHAGDPIARSVTRNPDDPIDLHFFMNGQRPLFVNPTDLTDDPSACCYHCGTQVQTGGDDIPNSGISVGGEIYLVYSTGSDVDCTPPCDPHAPSYSVLVHFDESTHSFCTLRDISYVSRYGHFLFNSLHKVTPDQAAVPENSVLMFGTGDLDHSDVYLAMVPEQDFPTLTNVRFFLGLDGNNNPIWSAPAPWSSDIEAWAQPVVTDDVSPPTIGNVSVSYVSPLALWLMTYKSSAPMPSGAQNTIFFRFARAPWGPWSDAQAIFDPCRDGGYGQFIHYSRNQCATAPATAGPVGPMGGEDGGNDPNKGAGHPFAPYMIEPFTQVNGNTLTIQYTMATFNPYTVVRMKSDFYIVTDALPDPTHPIPLPPGP
jgi:hypothetical protein